MMKKQIRRTGVHIKMLMFKSLKKVKYLRKSYENSIKAQNLMSL